MLITMLVAAVGVDRTLLRRLRGGWAFVLTFRREAVASLDLSHIAAATFPPSRGCGVDGALLDELLLVTGLAPLLQTNSRAEPCEKLFATDASPSGAGGRVAAVTQQAWPALYDVAEEKGELVRLDSKGEQHARWPCSRCTTCFEVDLGHVVLLPFLRRQAHQSLGHGKPD